MANYTSEFTGAEIDAGITLANSAQQPPAEGAFVDGDKTKLDGIETGATADQTASEIRALVESATDSNVFTDADHSKLNGIEDGADVTDATNVAAAGALMESDVVNVAQVKAFDATDYATSAQGVLADSAVQPSDLSDVATSGDYTDLSNKPSIPSVLGDLSNVSVTAATTGQVLKWDGTQWAPAADDTSDGGGSGIELTDLSVGPEGTPSGDGSLSYNSTTGVFTYTPPDLSVYATSASLSAVATSGDLADVTITSDTDFGSNKILYSNVYSALGDLPSASTYHGMFAHVHATGKGYFAHAGAWVELANNDQIANMVESDPTGVEGADAITNIISLTQADYDAITPDASTVYVISG